MRRKRHGEKAPAASEKSWLKFGVDPRPTTTQSPWTALGAKLFLLGFLTLFLELFFIRYLAGSVWNLGYFPNLVLLSAFIGMGVGFVFHDYLDSRTSGIVFQVGFALAGALVAFVSYAHPVVPGFDVWHYDVDGDLYFAYVPFKASDLNYFFFVLCFVLLAVIFASLTQRTAKVFRHFQPLDAYTLDILGSCAGIVSFMAVSALQLPAYAWFAAIAVIFIFAMAGDWRSALLPVVIAGVTIAIMHHQDHVFMRNPESTNPLQTIWSPYQKIEYVEEPPLAGQQGPLRRRIFVNGLDHQEMHESLANTFYQIPHLYRESVGLPPYKNVLVIGAGSGNDVTAALQHGAEHVDAVEIDPVIARLGKEHNPSRAYLDPRVTVTVDDGRAFLTQTKNKYDLIIFALTDSLVKVSSMTQLRLENYLFTKESVARAYELLNDKGNIVFYNFYRLPFVAEKIVDLLGDATGAAPKILAQNNDFYMVCGERTATPPEQPYASAFRVPMPTDDWPFLYLQSRGVPGLYLRAMGLVFIVITALLIALHFSTKGKEGFSQPGLVPTKVAFVLMGIAFLLLEAKSVIQFSLLFGATWFNNSLIFLAVLLSVLAANWTVKWLNDIRYASLFYGLLVAAVLSSYFIPLQSVLRIEAPAARFVVGSLLTLSPIYFGNLLFSVMFKDQKVAEHLFGWNLLGATFGGVLEYIGMAVGYNALSLVVLVCYTTVYMLLVEARRQMAACVAVESQ